MTNRAEYGKPCEARSQASHGCGVTTVVMNLDQLTPTIPTEHYPQRVLLLGNGSMFDDSLRQLLGHETDLDVTDMAYTDDTTLQMTIAHLCPHVIIVNDNGPVDLARIFQMLANLVFHTALRIVVVRVDDNTIDIYDKKHIVARASDDLLNVIRSGQA
jgi:hypothetical protein